MFQGVSSPEANLYVCVAKKSCYTSGLFAYICESDPFFICVLNRF
jgi:hypothetical protein